VAKAQANSSETSTPKTNTNCIQKSSDASRKFIRIPTANDNVCCCTMLRTAVCV